MRHATALALFLFLMAPCPAAPAAPTEADRWLEVLSDPSKRSWNDAIRALEALGPAALPQLRIALMDPYPNTRLQAARLIGQLGAEGAPAVEALALALEDPQATVKRFALEALGNLGPLPEDVRAAIAAAARKTRNSSIRQRALAVLAMQGTSGAAQLRTLLPEFHDDLTAAIQKLGPPATDALVPLLEDDSWYVRESAVTLFAAADGGVARHLPALLDLLDDVAPAVRLATVKTLGRGRGETVARALETRIADRHLLVRRSVAEALGGIADADGIRTEALLRCARNADPATRHLAIRALRRRGSGDAVLEVFRSALTAPEPCIRTEAALALVARGHRDPILVRPLVLGMRGAGLVTDPPFAVRGRQFPRTRETRTGLPPASATDITRGIATLGPLAILSLRDELATTMELVRANAVWTLGLIPGGTTDLLASRLDDGHRAVRVMAAVRLAERRAHLEDATSILVDALIRTVEFERVPGGPVAPLLAEGPVLLWGKRIQERLASLGADSVPALARGWNDDRAPLWPVLEQIGPAAIPPLRRLLEDERDDPALQRAVAEMLEIVGP